MGRITKGICGTVAIAALACSSPVFAGKGLGELYNLKYEAYGVSQSQFSSDGSVAMDVEQIDTVNCGGCDVVWYGPGTIFHLRNTSKKPVCASIVFTPTDSRNWQIHKWGSGAVYYLKGGQKVKKVGGLYVVSSGGTGQVDLGYSYSIRTWAPTGKKSCGADPYA